MGLLRLCRVAVVALPVQTTNVSHDSSTWRFHGYGNETY
jgi:hypothetical protein